MRSRVMPGSSPTMERRECVSRLNSVDLPTLGRPTMAKMGPEGADVGRMRDCLKRAFFKGVFQRRADSDGCVQCGVFFYSIVSAR